MVPAPAPVLFSTLFDKRKAKRYLRNRPFHWPSPRARIIGLEARRYKKCSSPAHHGSALSFVSSALPKNLCQYSWPAPNCFRKSGQLHVPCLVLRCPRGSSTCGAVCRPSPISQLRSLGLRQAQVSLVFSRASVEFGVLSFSVIPISILARVLIRRNDPLFLSQSFPGG